MENLSTVDSILEWFEAMAQNRMAIDPASWIDGSQKLVALLGNEQDSLFELESVLAKRKALLMEDSEMTASKAKIIIEGTNEYLACRKMKAKIERVFEFVRLAKIRARMAGDEMRGQM